MTTMPAMTQASQAAPPTSSTAVSGANSQPEPMIDVSEAQVAPIRPSLPFEADVCRYGGLGTDSDAMSNLLSGPHRCVSKAHPNSW